MSNYRKDAPEEGSVHEVGHDEAGIGHGRP
jgi:hypothetical protein